ncbi:MAG: hypothetical protein SV062_06335 [Thermodesulfobacteriota bacterium]|nr:hypothetical protein [Thermodesulfobacteriota bacterium]
MAVWKYTNKEVTEEDLERTLKALQDGCFKCGKEMHSDDCPIAIAKTEIKKIKREEGIS